MSFAALAWASKYRAGKAADKLVLLAYADRHNEETGCAYPSLAWLCEFSSLNRKTVIEAVGRLEQAGVLTDTGERQGATKQVKVYRVNIGTVPKTEPSRNRNSTEKAPKQSQKRDTDTVRTCSPTKASLSPEVASSGPVDEEPDDKLRPEHVLEAWNETAERIGSPKARMTDERRKKLRPFIRRWSADDIAMALSAIERSPFCCGENDRGWRANFDFLLQPSSFTKLIEGTYGH